MYQDFHERIEDWLERADHPRHEALDEVPAFLLQLPENEDHGLDHVAVLGEN